MTYTMLAVLAAILLIPVLVAGRAESPPSGASPTHVLGTGGMGGRGGGGMGGAAGLTGVGGVTGGPGTPMGSGV
jgi:hypothetical protein